MDNTDERRAPMQGEFGKNKKPPGTISWKEHLEAYEVYGKKYGHQQSAERLADRGGFGWNEFIFLMKREPRTWIERAIKMY